MDAAAQLRFAADAALAIARPAQLKPLRGVRCQDGAGHFRLRFCTERKVEGLGDTHRVDVAPGLQMSPDAVDESGPGAVLGVSSSAEMKP